MNKVDGTKRNIYKYMKIKRTNKSELPTIGIIGEIIGGYRLAALNEHFKSAYIVDEQNEIDFEQEINMIFESNLSNDSADLWTWDFWEDILFHLSTKLSFSAQFRIPLLYITIK